MVKTISEESLRHTAREEGEKRDKNGRHIMYKCSADKWTLGIGHNVEDNGISDRVAKLIFIEDMEIAENDARKLFKNFDQLSDARQGILRDLSFQLGVVRLSGFKKFIAAVNKGDFQLAKKEMLESKWAKYDSPARAQVNANIMQRGQW